MKRLFLILALAGSAAGATELTNQHTVSVDGTFQADSGNAVAYATDIACGRDDLTDLITCIEDMIAEALGGSPGDHDRYFGWAGDREIDAGDFAASTTNSSSTDEGEWQATATNAYPWFAVPEDVGFPTGLYRASNPINQIVFFPEQAATVTYNEVAYVIGVSQSMLTASTSTRPVRLEH